MESKSQSRPHTIQRVELPIVASSERFPVHQVYCVGRNYADHAIEMGHDPTREPPFFFIKPPYAVLSYSPITSVFLGLLCFCVSEFLCNTL